MNARAPLFRGEPRHVWIRRLEQRGWPSAAAAEMAAFLTEKGTPPPTWQNIAAHFANTEATATETRGASR